ncbi:MAG: hypothetical protein LH645_08675 [Actinomycetia bacterium]|nr:hypothetical protein [Actinomycetes bacterium]
MDTTLILMTAQVITLGAVLLATARTVSRDRPATPPGGIADWRDAELSWNRLGIR